MKTHLLVVGGIVAAAVVAGVLWHRHKKMLPAQRQPGPGASMYPPAVAVSPLPQNSPLGWLSTVRQETQTGIGILKDVSSFWDSIRGSNDESPSPEAIAQGSADQAFAELAAQGV